MLNCFYWYTGIWAFILFLYSFKISEFNKPLNFGLLMFIVITSLISLVLGIIFRKRFEYKNVDVPKYSVKNILVIVFGYLLEFNYAKSIPFISIAIFKHAKYGDFHEIPIFHVFLVAYSLYYAIKCISYVVCDKKQRFKYSFDYIVIMFLYFLCYYRSMIIIPSFAGLIIALAYLKKNKKIKFIHILISLILVLTGCYCYGAIGNVRDGYKWNDNSHIERLGMYTNFPKFIPKQFMWTYSYLTTPLANLNYNVELNNNMNRFDGAVSELLPFAISKRIFDNKLFEKEPKILRTYFNAVTGWCNMYMYYGIIGMYMLFAYMILLTVDMLMLRKRNVEVNKNKRNYTSAILCVVYVFMFFYNTLSYVGIALAFWMCFASLLFTNRKNTKKLKEEIKNES